MGLYEEMNEASPAMLFKYAVILILSLFFLKTVDVGLNIFLALLIATIVIMYYHEKVETDVSDQEKQDKLKADSIRPRVEHIKKYKDIIDLLYSIQDFSVHNPQTFEEMIDNIKAFFTLYESLQKGVERCEDYYDIAISKKENALNCLHALIYDSHARIPGVNKIMKAQEVLSDMLSVYLGEMRDICILSLRTTGFHNQRKLLQEVKPAAYNKYLNTTDFTFDIN